MQGKMKNNLHRDLDLIQFGGKYQRAEVVALLESELYNHHIPATKTNVFTFDSLLLSSLASQRKMCGASSAAVELLPAKTNQTPWLDEIKVIAIESSSNL